MQSINTECLITCTHCGPRIVTGKPVVRYTFSCTLARWQNDPSLKCPHCGMPKTVIVAKKKKLLPASSTVFVDSYEENKSKGLRFVGVN